MQTEKQTIIIDGDDTLWWTNRLYLSVMNEFYERLEQLGFSRSAAGEKFGEINKKLLGQIGLSRERLGMAMKQTYKEFCEQNRMTPDVQTEAAFVALAQKVYAKTPEPMEGAH